MDPLSQAVVGAVAAGAFSSKENLRRAVAVGALAAMSADLDIFIHSSEDHLLGIEFHRHFTHALIFIPVGALIVSLVLSFPFRVPWKNLYPLSFLGYATAAPLDALTGYGTHLFWPFSNERVAWNWISIIDPVYTLTLLVLVIGAFWRRRKSFFYLALSFIFFWHSVGFMQNKRVHHLLEEYAQSKGLVIERLWAQPSLANLIVWRGLIETKDQIYVVAVRVGLKTSFYQSGVLTRYFPEDDFFLKQNSVLAQDIDRFTHFSSGFVALADIEGYWLTDARYSPVPWETSPLWALELSYENQQDHARMKYFRETQALKIHQFWESLKGKGIFQ